MTIIDPALVTLLCNISAADGGHSTGRTNIGAVLVNSLRHSEMLIRADKAGKAP